MLSVTVEAAALPKPFKRWVTRSESVGCRAGVLRILWDGLRGLEVGEECLSAISLETNRALGTTDQEDGGVTDGTTYSSSASSARRDFSM